MACAYGELARDCAITHWCPALSGRAEGKGWRAPCPLCGAKRAIEFDLHGRGIRWNSFCSDHPKEALRQAMRDLLGGCLPGTRSGPCAADFEALAMSGLPLLAVRVRLLEWSGLSTTAALDKLGIDRTSRYRIRSQLSQQRDKPAGRLGFADTTRQPAPSSYPSDISAGRTALSRACFLLVVSSTPRVARVFTRPPRSPEATATR